MVSSSRSAPGRPPLEEVAELLVDQRWPGPVAVGVGGPTTGADLLVHALAPPRGPGELIGLVAPDHWRAFAFVAPARVLTAGSALGDTTVVFLVDRFDRSVTRTAADPRPLLAVAGGVVDCCRRVLRLPTAPPDRPTTVLVARIWLDRLLRTIRDGAPGAPPPGWRRCRQLLCPPPAAGSDTALIAHGRALARRVTWHALRTDRSVQASLGLSATEAAWFDDGSFCRWGSSRFGGLDEARRAVAALLAPATAARLEAVLDGWFAGSLGAS